MIAPSKIDPDDYLPIASFVFDQRFTLMHYFKEYLKSTDVYYKPEKIIDHMGVVQFQDHNLEELKRSMSRIEKYAPEITANEINGYAPLMIFGCALCAELEESFKMTFLYNGQFSVAKNGKNSSADGAALFFYNQHKWVPLFIFEYKCTVDYFITRITDGDLMEMVLQCHYAAQYYKLEYIVGRINDLRIWHIFVFKNVGKKLKVVACTSFVDKKMDLEILMKLLLGVVDLFLKDYIKPPIA